MNNYRKIDQFTEIARFLHEHAPDLCLSIVVTDPKNKGQWQHTITLTGGELFEDVVSPRDGAISFSGGFVSPTEDPLAIALQIRDAAVASSPLPRG
jgi:hypothetical protein